MFFDFLQFSCNFFSPPQLHACAETWHAQRCGFRAAAPEIQGRSGNRQLGQAEEARA